MVKKIFLGTNTKMYKTISQTVSFVRRLQKLTADIDRDVLTLFVIPSYTALDRTVHTIDKRQLLLGAQNMHWETEGQFTGEISPLMLKEIGVDIIEIGHSERRHVMGENDFDENKKVLSALAHDFTTLLCIGETKEQKELNLSNEVLATQLKIGLRDVHPRHIDKLWIAYEPVWAIGVNGTPASEYYANEKHAVIKEVLYQQFGSDSSRIPVLYGGNVNLENCEKLALQPHIDGLFVGRTAWDAERFNVLIRKVFPAFLSKQTR